MNRHSFKQTYANVKKILVFAGNYREFHFWMDEMRKEGVNEMRQMWQEKVLQDVWERTP